MMPTRLSGDVLLPSVIADDEIPFFAEVTAGGRITIPEEVRKIFEIRDGDAVLCRLKIMRKKKTERPKETLQFT